MKEILVARNALAAYLIISALSSEVLTIGVSSRYSGRYTFLITSRARSL